MPCWYYEKHELEDTASLRDGIDPDTESRYRREGARFIIDTGIKMGLRYDTCATGVVYFHRFYMFHSFREFHRYVTGACCLFLAGKVEETPKKCKDIVKMARSLLTDAQFIVFGEDPKEEVMTLERILLQTIKFDLQVEHPYAWLLKFAQVLKSDKGKVQKMVQMAWTFVNDSLCTTLCLQWEPNIVAVALMYLSARLSKVEITEWEGKPPGYRGKWWEFFLEEATLDLLEDVCHQVLDLYSSNPKKGEESPPPSAAKHSPAPSQLQASRTPTKKTSPNTPVSSSTQSSSSKPKSHVPLSKQKKPSGNKRPSSRSPSPKAMEKKPRHPGKDPVSADTSQRPPEKPSDTEPQVPPAQNTGRPVGMSYSSTYQQYQGSEGYSYPYGTQQMYSSSFMSQEGSQSIQSLIGHGSNSNSSYTQPSATSGQYTQPMTQYSQGAYQGQYQQGYQQAGYQQGQTGFQQQQYYNQQEFAAGNYGNQQANYQQNYQQQQSGYANQSYDSNQYGYNNQTGQTYPPQPPSGAPPLPTTPALRAAAPPAPPHQPAAAGQGGSTGLATVRITGRR